MSTYCCVGENLCTRRGIGPSKRHKCMNCGGYPHGAFCSFQWSARADHGISISDQDAKKVNNDGSSILPSAMVTHINSNPSKSDICKKCAEIVKALLSTPVSTPAAPYIDDDLLDDDIILEAAHSSGPPRPVPAPAVAAMRLTFDQFIENPAMHQFFNGMFDWGNSDNDNATVDPRDYLRWEWEGLNENLILQARNFIRHE